MSAANLGVLITRPEPGARATAARVARRGFVPILAPLLRITPTPTVLPPAATIATILVTSGNALAGLPLAYRATRLLTVGDATAEQARTAGFGQVQSAAGDARALAALAIRELRPRDGLLLLASGRGQGEPLAAALRQGGFRVVRRVVYAAQPVAELPPLAADALRARQLRAVLVFSAQTARVFVHLVRRARLTETLATVDAITIGQPAAVALRALSWRDIRVAARPNQDDMLGLLR